MNENIDTLLRLWDVYQDFFRIWFLCVGIAYLYSIIIYKFDAYEREPFPLLIAVFGAGLTVAPIFAYLLNTEFGNRVFALTSNVTMSKLAVGSLAAPVFEETLKGIVIAFVAWIWRREFDSVVDGIVYVSIVSLAFAATENAVYLYNGLQKGGVDAFVQIFFLRVILGAANHAVFTSCFGIGLALARLSRNWFVRISMPLAGLFLAIVLHSGHNLLALWPYKYTWMIMVGFDLLNLGFIAVVLLWSLQDEKSWIHNELVYEVNTGLITTRQSTRAGSMWDRNVAYIFHPNYWEIREFYQLLTKLAFKKHQSKVSGDDHGPQILALRKQIKDLKPYVP